MLSVRLNFKGKSPLAAMTCESTQPTLNTTARYICTRVRSKLRRNNCEKRSTIIRVAEGQITLARALCNVVARLERRSWCFTNIHATREFNANSPA